MKEVKKNPSMTYEEVLQNTDLAHFHEAIHLLKNRAHTDIFPRQYESAMMSVAEQQFPIWKKRFKIIDYPLSISSIFE